MIQAYFAAADALIYLLLAILVVLSVASWSVAVLRLKSTQKIGNHLDQLVPTIPELAACSGDWQKSAKLEQLQIQMQSKLGSGLVVIAVTASTAPFIGLLGTVWSIVKALGSVSAAAGLSAVSAQIGEALIMTGVGLLVAIPAVMLYNACVQLNRNVLARYRAALYHQASQTPGATKQAHMDPMGVEL